MDIREKCQQCIQLQKQNRLLRNQVIDSKHNLDKERASHSALQSEISYCEQAIQSGM